MINTLLFFLTQTEELLNLSSFLPLPKCIEGYLARQNVLGNFASSSSILVFLKGSTGGPVFYSLSSD